MADNIPKTDSTLTETPSFAQVLQDAFDARLCQLHTCLPGQVESYDSAKGTVDVQPLIKRKFKDGEIVDLPLCNSVPIVFPRTATSYIALPIKKGDVGLLVFSERSIDRYKTFGGAQDPQDTRKHSLSDGFFIPGGYPVTLPAVGIEADAIHLKNIASEIVMMEDGAIELRNPIVSFKLDASGNITLQNAIGNITLTDNGEVTIANAIGSFSIDVTGKVAITGLTGELVDLMSQHLDADIAHTHPTAVGPSGPPVNAAVYTALKVLVDGMKQ